MTLRKMDKAAFKKSQTVMEDDDDNGSYSEDKNAGEVDGFHCISLEGVNNSDFNIGLKVRQLSVGPPGWEYPMLKGKQSDIARLYSVGGTLVEERPTAGVCTLISHPWLLTSGYLRMQTF